MAKHCGAIEAGLSFLAVPAAGAPPPRENPGLSYLNSHLRFLNHAVCDA